MLHRSISPSLHRAAFVAAALLLLLSSNCAYSTRSRLPEHAKSIAVPVFGNKSYYDEYTRRLEVEVTDSVRKYFLENGQLRIAGREEADLILEGEVMNLERRPLRTDRFGEPAEAQVKISSRISLYDVKTAKYIFQNLLVNNEPNRPESGVYNLRRGEYEGLGRQRAVEDLSRVVTHKVLDQW